VNFRVRPGYDEHATPVHRRTARTRFVPRFVPDDFVQRPPDVTLVGEQTLMIQPERHGMVHPARLNGRAACRRPLADGRTELVPYVC
jgi:hypothetical protein